MFLSEQIFFCTDTIVSTAERMPNGQSTITDMRLDAFHASSNWVVLFILAALVPTPTRNQKFQVEFESGFEFRSPDSGWRAD